jgi:hypothetical protein
LESSNVAESASRSCWIIFGSLLQYSSAGMYDGFSAVFGTVEIPMPM